MKERCNKLLSHIRNSCTDAVMITSPINIRYFSGFTGSNGVLVITKNAQVLFTDFRYTIQAGIETKGLFEVREVRGAINHDVIGDFLGEQKCSFCGYEEEHMTVKLYLSFKKMPCELVEISRLLARIRMTKSSEEIEKIIKAQNISDKAFAELLNMLSVGMTEREVANELDYFLKKFGADEPSFDTIIASGPNGAL
ncbi:MAG: aminopeptidase P family protein, partial [Clostridiales bacterium]|nr:aminopeptidase P family protein [Clostridiales bacterium]